MWVRACANASPANAYCIHTKELQLLKNRLVIAKQHAVFINSDKTTTMHARTISLQIVRLLEDDIARKEKLLADLLKEYAADQPVGLP